MAYPIGQSYYQSYADAAAQQYGIPTALFDWQLGQESGWNPNAQNPGSSAQGIAQFTSGTAQQFGIDPGNPYQSIDAAAQYDAQLYNKSGNWLDALTSYGTLAPSNWAGGASDPGYQAAVAGASNALGGSGGSFGDQINAFLNWMNEGAPNGQSSTGAVNQTSTPQGSSVAAQVMAWAENGIPSAIIIVIGVVLLIGAVLMFAKSQGYELPPVHLPPVPVD